MSRDEMSALQGKRLNKLVNLVYHNVPFYRNKMQEMDLSPDDIQTIEDIVKLPFTTKQDLRDNYPYGLQAAPASEIVRVHASSGTTGNPTIVGYTRRDLSVWSEVMSRCLSAYGVTRNDTFSVSYGYGLFTGGLGAHYGVENLGATVIPHSGLPQIPIPPMILVSSLTPTWRSSIRVLNILARSFTSSLKSILPSAVK